MICIFSKDMYRRERGVMIDVGRMCRKTDMFCEGTSKERKRCPDWSGKQ